MKHVLSGSVIAAALIFAPHVAHAQTAGTGGGSVSIGEDPDVVVLKHGGQIRGKLVELLAGDHVTIAMASGQNAIIRWDEIGSVSRGGVPVKMPTTPAPSATTTTTPAPAAPLPPAYLGPQRMEYDSDDPVPPGYHVETHPRLGLLISGSILTGIGVIGIVAFDLQDHVDGSAKLGFDIVFGSLFLGPGLPLLLVGLASSRKELVRNDISLLQPIYDVAGIHGKAPPVFMGIDAHPARDRNGQPDGKKGLSVGFKF